MQPAYIGFSTGFIEPFAGFDLVGISVDAGDMEASASLYIPHFGIKMLFDQSAGKGDVVPCLTADFYLSMASVEVDVEGLGEEDSDMDELTSSVEEALEFWGFNVSFGAEYFVSDNFSVGGEYGLRYLKDSVDIGDQGEELVEGAADEVSATFKLTYGTFGLSYYF
jgi:opacity protein-like surface antigen